MRTSGWPKVQHGREAVEGRPRPFPVKLDHPGFSAPIYANLFDDEDHEIYGLIWSCSNGKRAY